MKKESHDSIQIENKLLKTENATLKQILEITPNHIYWKDANGVFLGCNKAQAIAAGFKTREEYIGKTDFEMPWGTHAQSVLDTDKAIMNSGKAATTEELVEFNGVPKTFLSTKTPTFDENKKVSGIIGVSIDITDRKKIQELEKELAVTQERLKVSKLMGASIAHEVRTPLARLALQVDLLEDAPFEEVPEIATSMLSAIKDAHTTVEMLLTKSKTGTLDIKDTKALPIKNTIEDSIREYPFKPGQKELLHLNLEDDFTFTGDAFYFKHLIFNLLKNGYVAIQKAQKGEITITSNSTARTLVFKDTGCGIPDDILPHIFESFYTQSERGTGVGLSLCKQITEAFGGTFECKTKLNQYTEFTMTFPQDKETS